MKLSQKASAVLTLTAVVFSVSLVGPMATFAATDPGLGAAATFSVLAQTAVTNVSPSVISGDVGLNTAGTNYSGLTSAEVAGTIYDTNGTGPDGASAILSPNVQADASTAFTSNIPGQSSNGSIGPVLDGLVLTPGVYDIGAGRLNGGVLTLSGAGTYIFRASSDFVTSGSVVLTNGAQACDVYWRVQTLATVNGSSFVGTILAGSGVHFGSNVSLNGRALAVGGDVTLISDTISGPTCAPAAVSGTRPGTINVVKTVINDNGGTKTVADFPLFINGVSATSGVTYSFSAFGPAFTVTETSDPNYTRTFSGDCDVNGQLNLSPGQNKFCIVTNNDIGAPAVPVVPPLIDVVKVPSPLALPGGPGPVNYTYTVRNIGTVPMTNVTLVGDTCGPIVLSSGDTNGDSKLDMSETWIYHCSTTLTETHTNTVVATGWANGISSVDAASATVVVGAAVVPPLIHVTKIPSPLALQAAGGVVTYTEKITNPGTIALSNVNLTDDKCGPLVYVSGDVNGDSLLAPTETWTYTCRTTLAKTTTNTAIASGTANGFTVRDIAVATVVVPVTGLPNTGIPPEEQNLARTLAVIGLLALGAVGILRKRIA